MDSICKIQEFLYEFFSYSLVDFVVSPIWPLPTNAKGWVLDFVGLVTPYKLGGFLFKATRSMAYAFVRGTFLTATNSIQGQVCDSVGFFGISILIVFKTPSLWFCNGCWFCRELEGGISDFLIL